MKGNKLSKNITHATKFAHARTYTRTHLYSKLNITSVAISPKINVNYYLIYRNKCIYVCKS